MKYQYKVKMPEITIYAMKKTPKRKVLMEAAAIILVELEHSHLYEESKTSFKVKTTRMKNE
jgi:hypothetical protein